MDLEELYDKLLKYCYNKTHDRYLAEDIVQDTFVRFYSNHTYKETGKKLAYLYTIARNLCIDSYRQPRIINIDEVKEFICTLVMSLLFTAVTVFLSLIMSNTAAMGIQMGIMMVSFLNVPLKNPLLQKLWNLRPTHYMNGWLENFYIFNLGTLQLNSIQMAKLLYAIGAVIFSAITIVLYKSYQVKSR